MADVGLVLSWLGMRQYRDCLVNAGFISWQMVADMAESDMEKLGVTAVHRKKLRREIAKSRDTVRIAAAAAEEAETGGYGQWPSLSDDMVQSVTETTPASTKRKYRHRPKHDPNAPERPYSAYVMFSNHMRDELKEQNLTFTEISRAVGSGWRALQHNEKEAWQGRAATQMTKYKGRLADYHRTESYQRHKKYVSTFKSAQEARESVRKHARTSSVAIPAVSPDMRMQDSDATLDSPRSFVNEPKRHNLWGEVLKLSSSMESKINSSDLDSTREAHYRSSDSSFGPDPNIRQRSINP